jgi:hypothetical protein
MFVEFTTIQKNKVLVVSDNINYIIETSDFVGQQLVQCRRIEMKNGSNINIIETFDEIKKRVGLAIPPRAETLSRFIGQV